MTGTCARENAEFQSFDSYPAYYVAWCPECEGRGGGDSAETARAAIVCKRTHQPKETPDAE